MKMFGIAVLFAMLLTGCAGTANLKRLSDVKPTEVVVIAKVNIQYNGDDETVGAMVLANLQRELVQIFLAPDGYAVVRLPQGKNTLDALVIKNAKVQRQMPTDTVVFNVEGPGPVYIGDLNIDWKGAGWGATLLGINPLLAAAFSRQGDFNITVTSDVAAAQAALDARFKMDRPLTASLAKVTLPVPETETTSVSPTAAVAQ